MPATLHSEKEIPVPVNPLNPRRLGLFVGSLLAASSAHSIDYAFPGNLPGSCKALDAARYVCAEALKLADGDTVGFDGPASIEVDGALETGDKVSFNAKAAAVALAVGGPVSLGQVNTFIGSIATRSADIAIGAGSTVVGALTADAGGAIQIGAQSTVTGDVATTALDKGSGGIGLDDGATVVGSLSTNVGAIAIGKGSKVSLNVLAYDGSIAVGEASTVGGSLCTDLSASISVGANAQVGGNVETAHDGSIDIAAGVTVIGSVTARGAGKVSLDSAATVGEKTIGLACALSPDADGDGVADSLDEFPNDKDKASSVWYPGSDTFGTLVFEDNWPFLGDYDLNDLVVRYRSRQILNAQRQVKALEMDLSLVARGASYQSGFGLALPGIAPDRIASVVLTQNGVATTRTVQLDGVKSLDGGGVVFEIFPDAVALLRPDNSDGCALKGFTNTAQACPIQPAVNFKLTVELILPSDSFPSAPYDPFIFNSVDTKRIGPGDAKTAVPIAARAKTLEVHLPGKQPTSRADTTLLGTQEDGSKWADGKYANSYLSQAKGLPWALDIPSAWDYPIEKLDVVKAYPGIVDWATSGGASSADWYVKPLSPDLTFRNGR